MVVEIVDRMLHVEEGVVEDEDGAAEVVDEVLDEVVEAGDEDKDEDVVGTLDELAELVVVPELLDQLDVIDGEVVVLLDLLNEVVEIEIDQIIVPELLDTLDLSCIGDRIDSKWPQSIWILTKPYQTGITDHEYSKYD